MSLIVRLYGRLMRAAGTDKIEIRERVGTVDDLIKTLINMKPELSHILREDLIMNNAVLILVNGHSVRMMEGMKTKLLSGDVVTIDRIDILQTVGGG